MENSDDSYRILCSSETLRSSKKGFFHDFSELVMETAGDSWTSKIFGRFNTDEERVRAVFTDAKIKDIVVETLSKTQIVFRDKDAEISRLRRLEASQTASTGQFEKALLLFSQAVLRAPITGKCRGIDQGFSLPLALLARAETFIDLQEYDRALEDLTLAEENKLPEKLMEELAKKRKKCQSFVEVNETAVVPVVTRNRPRGILPRLTGGKNPELPGASMQIEIRETPFAGKHAVATKTVHPGDVLVVEPPIAACLLPEFFGTHCHHCFTRLRAPIGCPECSSVAFCGRKCRDIAIFTYHKYECKVIALLIGSGMSVLSLVALRMITQEGLERCLKIYDALMKRNSKGDEIHEEISTTADSIPADAEPKLTRSAKRRLRKKKQKESKEDEKNPEICQENKNTRSQHYHYNTNRSIDLRAYQLVMHEKIRHPKDFLERTLMTAFLLKCLQRVNFFHSPSKDDEVPNQEEIAVGTLILKNLQLLQFNAHEVFETRLGMEHRFRGSRPVYLGVAIYPTVARFNHDCYPAVTRYFVGRNIVIRGTRVLHPGDVIAENYGPIFTKRNLQERQRTLAGRYWFRCLCKACQEDWPGFAKLTNDIARLRCPTKRCKHLYTRPERGEEKKSIDCPTCRKKITLEGMITRLLECEILYARGFSEMDEEKPEQAIETLIQAIRKFHKIAVPPHKDTHLAEIALSSCMADSGNTWRPTL